MRIAKVKNQYTMFVFAPAYAANGRRLIRSVTGSLCGVLISRVARIVLADRVIPLYMVYGSAILKNYLT